MKDRDTITIRHSTRFDRAALRRLAELDGRPAPAGEALLALVDGELRAALPLAGGEALADPFHRTAELVDLLRVRAEPDRGGASRRVRRLPYRPALAGRAA
jgi:hypothetical protein